MAHPLAGQDVVTAESVAGEIMFVRRDCEALADVSRYFTGRGIRPFMAGRTRSEDRSIAYIRAGLGITVMPRCLGAPSVAISELAGFSVTRAIGLLIDPLQHHLSRSTTLNCLAHALLELAREVPGIRLS
jgi:DNA-binding transcriptional LysR family regulator